MKRIMLAMLALALLAACSLTERRGGPVAQSIALKQEPMPPNLLMTIGSGAVNPAIKSKFEKEPNYPSTPQYGQMYISGLTPMGFVLYASPDQKGVDLALIDQDQDKDLTDEKPIALPKQGETASITLAFGGNKPVKMSVNRYRPEGFMLAPTVWYRGAMRVNGKERQIALISRNLGGFAPNGDVGSTTLAIDKDGDGKLYTERQVANGLGGTRTAALLEESILLSIWTALGGDIYTPRIEGAGERLVLEPYAGPWGEAELAVPKLEDATVSIQVALSSAGKGPRVYQRVNLPDGESVCRVPADDYYISSVRVTYSRDGKIIGRVSGVPKQSRKATALAEGKPARLDFVAPKSLAVLTTPGPKRVLKIGQSPIMEGPMKISVLYRPGKSASESMKRVAAPVARVFDASGAKIAEHSMEYG